MPVVLLHGSGGDEFDLMPLASELAPKAAHLGIRGTVDIDGGYAFFHRFPDRRVNEADIGARAPVLAKFIEATCAHHNCLRRPLAIGFSNGATMAAAILLTHPALLAGAILFRPLGLDPYVDGPPPQGVLQRFDRSLRPYVRPVDALAHERWPRWFPRQGVPNNSATSARGPLGLSECPVSWIDRSHHLLIILQVLASAQHGCSL